MTSVIQQAMVFILIIFLACFIKLRGYIKEVIRMFLLYL